MPVPNDITPAGYGWKLLETHTASEDQIGFLALLVEPMQRAWMEKPLHQTKLKPTSSQHFARIVGLGGGGCGKSWLLNKMVAPLINFFFEGHNSYLAMCATNAGARHVKGRTVHVASGLNAASSLKISALHMKEDARRKMEFTTKHTACLACDELSQVGGPLFHGCSLRFSIAREAYHKLDLAKYLEASQTFGAVFAVLLLGDFYQLPPVPEKTSLLYPVQFASYEQQQARVLLESFDLVYEFRSAKRFTCPLLKEILHSMRQGCQMSDAAWQALKKTQVKPGDTRLSNAGDFYECSYSWEIVSLAQQLRPIDSAKKTNHILYYIQAVDRPARQCSEKEHRQLLQTASMSDTNKLMGLLPIHIDMVVRLTSKIVAPDLVQEREGTVVGIEFRHDDARSQDLMEETARLHGHYVCKSLPLAIYVKIHDYNETILPCSTHEIAQPDPKCTFCQSFAGIVAIRPTTCKWEAKLGEENLAVRRTQFALAPALVKTIHSTQGTTAQPGLIAHWSLPATLPASSVWLSHYVLMSRVRSLHDLLSVGLPSREALERGPPTDLRDRINNLFEAKIATTHLAATNARHFLNWPRRGQ